jgi:DeoR family transcriptional regulator, fructose operon transcriptional repressor
MLAAERKLRIVDLVKQKRVMSVNDLAKEFQVSEATVRRDLADIETEGLLRRTRGGVVVDRGANIEAPFVLRSEQQVEQKMRIGARAASLVEDGDHIILDSGTTTLYIARNLVNRSNITVVTNDINVAAELRDAPGVTVVVAGGVLYKSSFMLNGHFTDAMYKSIHVQKAFVSAPAFHPKHGITNAQAEFVPAKQALIEAAQEVIAVMDDTKLGKLTLHSVAPVNAVHTLITGVEASEAHVRQFREAGVNVMTV